MNGKDLDTKLQELEVKVELIETVIQALIGGQITLTAVTQALKDLVIDEDLIEPSELDLEIDSHREELEAELLRGGDLDELSDADGNVASAFGLR